MENRTELLLELGRLNKRLQDSAVVDSVQYCRLAAEISDDLLSKSVELARKSQSFYRSASLKQWLRTAILHEKDGQDIVHSNVVPRKAYLDAFCPASHELRSCRGFSRVRSMNDRAIVPCPRSCEDCALAEHMKSDIAEHIKSDNISDMEVDHSNTLVKIMEVELEHLQDLAPSVYKVLWNCGTFVRKTFKSEGILRRELLVAAEVLHPNIVHCFGFSLPVEFVEFHECQDKFDNDSYDDSGNVSLQFHNCQDDFGDDSDEYDSDDDSDDDCDDDCDDDSDNVSYNGDMYMEWLDGDLHQFLVEKGEDGESPFSFREVLDVLLQVAKGMKHLHEKNFVHMDLKTQNIFMSCFELAHSGVMKYLVKVGDFGSAQRVNAGEPFRAYIGTPIYTAPEVFTGRRGEIAPPLTYPLKIDVYSFGVVAFQVLTGVANPYGDLYGFRLQEAVVGGRRPNTDYTGTLDDDRASLLPFIERCWAEDPKQRPDFSDICEELKKAFK